MSPLFIYDQVEEELKYPKDKIELCDGNSQTLGEEDKDVTMSR